MSDQFTQTVKSLVPYWTNSIISSLTIGNEYGMFFNLVINSGIDIIKQDYGMTYIVVGVILYLAYKALHNSPYIKFSLFKKHDTTILVGYEFEKEGTVVINYSNELISLNNYLIEKCDVKQLRHYKYFTCINDIKDLNIGNKMFLSVTRETSGRVEYTLVSKNGQNLKTFISEMAQSCSYKYNMIMSGLNTITNYKYPKEMEVLSYMLVHKYNMNTIQLSQETIDAGVADDTGKLILKTPRTLYTLFPCSIVQLKESGVFITITKTNDIITYHLMSNSVELKEFIEQLITEYKVLISKPMYKYQVKLFFTIRRSASLWNEKGDIIPSYNHNICAINHNLIEVHGIKTYFLIGYDHDSKSQYKYVETDAPIYINNGIKITLTQPKMGDNKYCEVTEMTYVLESNEYDVEQYIKSCVKEYDQYLANRNKNNLYHFTYRGSGKFIKSILHNSDNPIYESFDTMFSEHSQTIKQDLDQINDIEYYRRTGLKRKKAYMFHGQPGCGKTSMVVTMALYSNRHIIDIPASSIVTVDDLDIVSSIESILNVEITKSSVIYLFDEIDEGFATLNRNKTINGDDESNDNKTKPSDTKLNISVLSLDGDINGKPPSLKVTMGNILSRFDGVGNYNGMILVGTTNYLKKLDKALYRDLRLTPYEFTYLREIDAIKLIENFFKKSVNVSYSYADIDHKISPAKLLSICERQFKLTGFKTTQLNVNVNDDINVLDTEIQFFLY